MRQRIKRIISAVMMADHLQTSNATLHSIMLPINLEVDPNIHIYSIV
ncbi:MAG: hypothetical protein MR461_05955 [Prevotella sp.]|nr:hypothetical protein [Prevotella sp.]MDD7720983.1 hypothetical protein [Leyella stercorea]MCI6688039.1 hypothetical protein [Prevotella sp.]MCI7021140.1 hypothetical protein [Prevotella sp.]MCI7154507.1 hypothetical protein [Prevotella sp.]